MFINKCGDCHFYEENYEFNTLPGRCKRLNKHVGKFEVHQCYLSPRHTSISITDSTKLVPIDSVSKKTKDYLVWLSGTNNIIVSVEQKNDNQDDYDIIFEYIENKYGLCKCRIISLNNLEKVNI